MIINFKIFFKESLDEGKNIVLLRGNLLKFTWNKLKEKIIENSHNPYFQSKNLVINENDNILLNLIEAPQIIVSANINFIYDDKSLTMILDIIKNNLDEDKEIKMKFALEKIKEEDLKKYDNPKYDIYLKEALNNIWKHQKSKIKDELNELELFNSKFIFAIENINSNNINNLYINKNILCNECLTLSFYGYRYICSYCNNYNLCYTCYKKGSHNKEHNFILFKKPIIDEDDINLYNCRFSPNHKELKDIKENFEIEFEIINVGEKDLQNCYIGYIRITNNNYLYCNKHEIKEKLEKNGRKKIKLQLKFDDKEKIFLNNIEGNFRLFNKNGIPFGEIFKIKVINENYFLSKYLDK